MYYQYWGMQKAPFDNVPDPGLYWNKNSSLEDAIFEILFTIEEGNDCLAVMVGDIGTGKTLGLRVILNELDPEKYRIAFITNPDLSRGQLIREIIGQLKNKKISINYKDQLLEEFNAILFECANQGQKVVILIDEANVMSTAQLHNLRLMTNFQDDQQNMVIFVLAGQKELGNKLETRALENLYQRIGVYCRIKGLGGTEAVYQYVKHRIQACGGSPEIFTKEACDALWAHSYQGVPRLINKIAKLCLKAGETNQMKHIDAEIVNAVASMFEREKIYLAQSPGVNESFENKNPESTFEPKKTFFPSEQNDTEVMDFIKRTPSGIHSQIRLMEDEQLLDLAGKMAMEYIQQVCPKNSSNNQAIFWDTIKEQIFSSLKFFRENKEEIFGDRKRFMAGQAH